MCGIGILIDAWHGLLDLNLGGRLGVIVVDGESAESIGSVLGPLVGLRRVRQVLCWLMAFGLLLMAFRVLLGFV